MDEPAVATTTFKKRLFVGNLSDQICSDDLIQRFNHFGTVDKVDLRNKNEAVFAFVDIQFNEGEAGQKKCIDVLNNTKWKGLTLKVQLAKENFLDKLKKERELSRHARKPRPPDNFDFEIISSLAVAQSTPKSSTTSLPVPAQDDKDTSESDDEKPDFSNLTKLLATAKSPKPAATLSPGNLKAKQRKDNIKQDKSQVIDLPELDSTSDPDSSEDEIPVKKTKLPPFKGILAYPSLGESEIVKVEPILEPPPPRSDAELPVSASAPVAASPQKGLKLNPLKKQKSDALRVQSWQSRVELKKSREAIIHHALSNASLTEQQVQEEKTKSKKADKNNEAKPKASRDFLFGDGEDEDDKEDSTIPEEDQFKVRPQYEGESGQRLMELNAKFGGDSRFRLDERFAEEGTKTTDSKEDGIQNETEVQMNVLNELFGHPITLTDTKKSQSNKASVAGGASALGLIRYQPSSLEHKMKYEIKVKDEEEKERLPVKVQVNGHGTEEKQTESKKKSKRKKGTENDACASRNEQGPSTSDPPATMEKATYKVVSNLKSLFTNDSSAKETFSVLSFLGSGATTEGKSYTGIEDNIEENPKPKKSKKTTVKDDREHNQTEKQTSKPSSSSFWTQPNPFKYDSSDDEGEATDKKTKPPSTKQSESTSTPKPRPNLLNDQSNLFKSESFFFQEGDPRLENVFENFLASVENLEEVISKFNEDGRAELKTIAKAKWRNSRRKNEKRVRILKLIRKKKRRDALKKQQHHEKIRAIKERREEM